MKTRPQHSSTRVRLVIIFFIMMTPIIHHYDGLEIVEPIETTKGCDQ